MSRGQLLELGFSAKAIEHRVRRGRLRPVARGVYAVGRPELTGHGVWMTAVLVCGQTAFLSHGSAAALWGIGSERRGLEVSVLGGCPRPAGVIVHRRRRLDSEDLAVRERIPVTSPAMTLLDHACRLSGPQMERMVNEADRLGLISPPELRSFLKGHRHQDGVARLRFLLDRRAFTYTETDLEAAFLPLAAAAELSVPLTQPVVNGYRVDFFWPGLGLVVETDGLRYHRTPAEQARDRLRDQAHTAAGMTCLRFTHDQVRYEPEYVRSVLAATVSRLGAGTPRSSAAPLAGRRLG